MCLYWNDLSDLQGASKTKIPIFSSIISLKHTDKDVNSVDIHISIFYDGSAVAAVSIAMTILHENEGKTDEDFFA